MNYAFSFFKCCAVTTVMGVGGPVCDNLSETFNLGSVKLLHLNRIIF
jgi:hypothetical protein